MFELNEISRLRKQLGLTQAELAKLSGVSQSLIAKLEAGKIEPSYSKAKALFETLQKLQRRDSKRAKDILSKSVEGIQSDKTLQEVADLMHKKAISQVPVYENGKIVGSITEKTILKLLSESRSPADAFRKRISQVMEEPFPTVHEDTPLELVYPLFDYFQAVIVTKRDKVQGIITKGDLLKLG